MLGSSVFLWQAGQAAGLQSPLMSLLAVPYTSPEGKKIQMKSGEEAPALISRQYKILTKLLRMETRRHFSRRCIRSPYWLPLPGCKLRASATVTTPSRRQGQVSAAPCRVLRTGMQGREQSSTAAARVPSLLFQLGSAFSGVWFGNRSCRLSAGLCKPDSSVTGQHRRRLACLRSGRGWLTHSRAVWSGR